MHYHDDDTMRENASTRPEVKLLCRLLNFRSNEDDDHHWKWTIPADIHPAILSQEAELLEDAIRHPFEMFGESYSSLVARVRKERARKTVVNENGDEEEVRVARGRAPRQQPQRNAWLDDDLIEDSDEELEAIAALMGEKGLDPPGQPSQTNSEDEDQATSSRGESSPEHHGSSPRRRRESSSATDSSIHTSSYSTTVHTAKKGRLRRQRAQPLFLHSDDEEEREDAARVEGKKRLHLFLSASDDEDSDEHAPPTQQTSPVRKRRALIQDDEE